MISILILVVTSTLSRHIQVPPVTDNSAMYLKIDSYQQQNQIFKRFGNLQHVSKKQIFQYVDGKQILFSACQQSDPQINFKQQQTYALAQNKQSRSKIIYQFQQMQLYSQHRKYTKNLIDIVPFESSIFYIKQNGELNLVKLDQNKKVISQNKHKGIQEDVNQGNLIIVSHISNLSSYYTVFINSKQAIIYNINEQKFIQIQNFNNMTRYQSAISIQKGRFAAAFGKEGVKIFKIDNNTLIQQKILNSQYFNSTIDIRDVTYDPQRKILFILDYNQGVIPLKIFFGVELVITPTSSIIPHTLCSLLYLDNYNDFLYLQCKKAYKYDISQWPVVKNIPLPHQLIKIRQIVSYEDITIFAGRNTFQVLSGNRRVAVYQDTLLDKILIDKNNFISANEDSIIFGKFFISEPILQCKTNNRSLLGKHKLVFKAVASCNTQYFDTIKFQVGGISEDDRCLYTIYKQMHIWQSAIFDHKPFMIVGIIIMVLLVCILLWWIFSCVSIRNFKRKLDNYDTLQQQMKETPKDKKENGFKNGGTGEKFSNQKGEDIHDIE